MSRAVIHLFPGGTAAPMNPAVWKAMDLRSTALGVEPPDVVADPRATSAPSPTKTLIQQGARPRPMSPALVVVYVTPPNWVWLKKVVYAPPKKVEESSRNKHGASPAATAHVGK